MQVLTPHARRKQARDRAIAKRYAVLMRIDNAMKSQVVTILMREFKIKAPDTIYAILKREQNRVDATPNAATL